MVVDFDSTSSKIVSPVKLAHVVLRTQLENFQRMTSFYKTFLGGHATYENDVLSFITYDDEHHRIAIAGLPGINGRNSKTCGLEHTAFTFSTLEELLLAYRQRKAHGIEPVWAVNHGTTVSLYYRDPDGNQIETQVDCFDTTDEANRFMMSDEFCENPIGVDFDPEDYIQKLKSGVPVADIVKRPRIGPRSLADVPLIEL